MSRCRRGFRGAGARAKQSPPGRDTSSPSPESAIDLWSEERVNGRLQELMESATDLVLERADEGGVSHRAAAYELAVERVADAGRARGWH